MLNTKPTTSTTKPIELPPIGKAMQDVQNNYGPPIAINSYFYARARIGELNVCDEIFIKLMRKNAEILYSNLRQQNPFS